MSIEEWEGAHSKTGLIVLAIIGCLFLWDFKNGGCVVGAGMSIFSGRDAMAGYYECQGTKSEEGAQEESTFKQAAAAQQYFSDICEQAEGTLFVGEALDYWNDIRTENRSSVCSCLGSLYSQSYTEHETILPAEGAERDQQLHDGTRKFLQLVTTQQLDECI
jgi:hypothetical protein